MKILETIDSGKKTFLYAVEYYLQRATSILIHLFTSSLIKYVKVVWIPRNLTDRMEPFFIFSLLQRIWQRTALLKNKNNFNKKQQKRNAPKNFKNIFFFDRRVTI